MDHVRLHDRFRPDLSNRVEQALEPVANHHVGVRDAPVLQLRQDLQPELRALGAVTRPQAKDVPSPVNRDGQGEVDGRVGDLPIADLHVHRVKEDHRVHRIQGPILPLSYSA